MNGISVARALIELKTIANRLTKAMTTAEFVAIVVGKKLPPRIESIEAFTEDAKSIKDKIIGLIDRYRLLKSAIVKSNATTMVTINDEKMSVADAIERKTSIDFEAALLGRMNSTFSIAVAKIDSHNQTVEKRLDQLLESTLKKESSKIKGDEYNSIAEPFMKNNKAELIDPLGVKDMIQKLETKIDLFKQEVDIALTESNAKTIIDA